MLRRFISIVLFWGLLIQSFNAFAQEFSLPENTTIIEEGAFQNCNEFSGVLTIPNGVTEIGAYAFAGCSGFTGTPIIPATVQTIGKHAFDGCTGLIGTVYLSPEIQLDDTAFLNCPGLNVTRSETYDIAFITDVGLLMDHSFNEETWNGVLSYANDHNLSCNYFQPANGDNATDNDRYDAMKAAAEAGARAIVCAGFMQGAALEKAANEFTDVKFIFIDGWPMGVENVVGVTFREEQCGYLAGYAAVMDGYEKLGFSGGSGGTNPAIMRYGYGYIQGANDAAAKLGKNVEIKFTWAYGASFSPSAKLQNLISGWYETGTEVVFSCGGGIFYSIVASASINGGAVIGVDVDQSYESSTVITSAMKNLAEAAYYMLNTVFDGTWKDGSVTLGAAQNAVCLPVDTWCLNSFTIAEYEALKNAISIGEVTIDSNAAEFDPNVKGPWSNVTVDYIE